MAQRKFLASALLLSLLGVANLSMGLTLTLTTQHPAQNRFLKAEQIGKANALRKVDPMLTRAFSEYATHQQKDPGKPKHRYHLPSPSGWRFYLHWISPLFYGKASWKKDVHH